MHAFRSRSSSSSSRGKGNGFITRWVPALALATLAGLSVLAARSHWAARGEVPHSSRGRETHERGFGCQLRTRSGICIPHLFSVVDDVYSPLWPAPVDVLIRSYFSPRLLLLGPLWLSLDLLWPKGLGKVVLVLDEGDALHGPEALVPNWVEVKYERNYMDLPGKILQQWSYGWADNYTTAPYIAIFDDDVTLNLKVTPPLLFNLSTGRPFILGSKEQGYYRDTTKFFLGRHSYFANFMVSLPFIQPREALPLYRKKIGELHPEVPGGYDEVMQWWAQHGGHTKEQIAHTVMGNFLYNFAPDTVSFSLEWADNIPVPRVGVHVPYTKMFADLGGTPRANMLNSTSFLSTASFYTREALCFSFPPGEAPNCIDMPEQQSHIWRYAWDRERWRAIRKRRPNAFRIYRDHLLQLHCIYRKVTDEAYSTLLRGGRESDKLLEQVRKSCLQNVKA